MKQIGKQGRVNATANKNIAKMFMDHSIYYCEVCPVLHDIGELRYPCLQSGTNAHRHGRVWYRSKPELLWDFTQVVKSCINSHTLMDDHGEIRDRVFMILRGKETC